jgi:hypothetical protein
MFLFPPSSRLNASYLPFLRDAKNPQFFSSPFQSLITIIYLIMPMMDVHELDEARGGDKINRKLNMDPAAAYILLIKFIVDIVSNSSTPLSPSTHTSCMDEI